MEKTMKNSWLRGSCIGRGAYGTVSAAVNPATGAVFAVKSVDLATAPPSHVETLENEIRILSSLSSPFIVKYLGDDTTAEGSLPTPFRNLHMEYLPGGTAADLEDSGEAAVASYTWCLVSALSYLHSRGIVHCDVKGKNVLLGASPGSASLADFGSAVEISSVAAARGSPLWMAPEVIRGERQGLESDVWSVGCTVIEMLTGKPPAWGAASAAASVYRIGYSDELPLFPARLSGSCADFLDKCLRRDYARRWSCDQLLQHPFISMSPRKDTADHWSPRCVLDCFNSDFHEEEEDGGGGGGGGDGEAINLEGNERIRGLVSGARAGANWESDGWLVVRGHPDAVGEGTCSEYSDLFDDGTYLGANSGYHTPTRSIDLNSDFDPSYSIVNCRHFNCNSNGNVAPLQYTQVVERLYDCSKFGFVYIYLHVYWNLVCLNLKRSRNVVAHTYCKILNLLYGK